MSWKNRIEVDKFSAIIIIIYYFFFMFLHVVKGIYS